MPPLPGQLLLAGELREGQLVEGYATVGGWSPATVLSVVGEGADASATLKFIGYGPRWNQAFKDAEQAIRVRVSKEQRDLDNMPARWKEKIHLRNADGTWPIEKIMGKRKRGGRIEYRVRWKEFDEEDDSWESSYLKPEIVEEFEESELLAAKRAAKLAAKASKPPPAPFTRAIADAESDEVKQLRIADADTTIEFLGDAAGERTARLKTALAEAKFGAIKPFTAVAFNALRERLASEVEAGQDVDLAVTPIMSLRRGQRPVDTFSVMNDTIVNTIVGDDALVLQPNGTQVKIVPPLDFFLRAQRDAATGELKKSMELVAKAHWVALVRDHGAPGYPIFRIDERSFEYSSHDEAAYKRAMAGALVRRAATGGAVSTEFVTWASQQ